jgi:hypothetical protein
VFNAAAIGSVGVFVSRFPDALERFRRRRLSADEAGELLGVSGRQFRRLCVGFDAEGEEGLRDRRLGKASPRRADAAVISRMCGLFRDCYRDFSVRHFHETLVREHHYTLCYTVARLALHPAWSAPIGSPNSQAPPSEVDSLCAAGLR